MFEYSDLAAHTPPLAEGLTANDLIRMTLDRYLASHFAGRVRLEASISNLANAESTRGPDGQPYRRRNVVLTSAAVGTFDEALGQASAAMGVQVAGIVEDQSPPRRQYEPAHADADGLVNLPNVDPAEEMVDMGHGPY